MKRESEEKTSMGMAVVWAEASAAVVVRMMLEMGGIL